jgi:hypothetical protein
VGSTGGTQGTQGSGASVGRYCRFWSPLVLLVVSLAGFDFGERTGKVALAPLTHYCHERMGDVKRPSLAGSLNDSLLAELTRTVGLSPAAALRQASVAERP